MKTLIFMISRRPYLVDREETFSISFMITHSYSWDILVLASIFEKATECEDDKRIFL